MKVELLYFEGCPHLPEARARLEQVLAALAPTAERVDLRVETPEDARRLGFLGSPSIRVDGVDLEGRRADPDGGAICCRLYGTEGPPPRWMIEAAVLRALRPRGYLFLCVANSARSQMAEGIARSLAPETVAVASAGSVPLSVRPEAVQVMAEVGIDISAQRAKGVGDLDTGRIDAVVTLCDDEVCPAYLHRAHRVHWSLPDPAAGAARLDAFRAVRDTLRHRIGMLFK